MTLPDLTARKCTACQAGAEPLKGDKLREYSLQVPAWDIVGNDHHISRSFKFKNFAQALEFVNKVGELAEQEGHHPWIAFTWGIVRIDLWTHKIDGLHESDFILAAKIDRIE
ncbi:MAG: 4a-hydroxytetrahydrobiopterin dehydratase [Phycisphaerae bacterium]|jgi:4a-hydroxytetrahydrobiopterin dehydratase